MLPARRFGKESRLRTTKPIATKTLKFRGTPEGSGAFDTSAIVTMVPKPVSVEP
jgi:hypothetical protein